MNKMGQLIVNGLSVSYTDFFKAYGYGPEDNLYIRVFYDDISDKKQYEKEYTEKNGRKPTQSYNPLNTKFNKVCKLKDFDKLCMKDLFTLNANNYGMYFAVNGGHSKNAVRENSFPRAQFSEIDDQSFEEQTELINSFPLSPSIIVKTKKSLHCYWLIDDGNFTRWVDIQERLIKWFHSDGKIKDESRVMRIPGFFHCKDKNNKAFCDLVKFDPNIRYTQDQLLEVLPGTDAVFTYDWDDEIGDGPDDKGTRSEADQSQELPEKVRKNCTFLERFLDRYQIGYKAGTYTIRKTGETVQAFYLTDENSIPWHDEYTTPWNDGDTLIFVRTSGMICLSGRHDHDEKHSWKDFRAYYEPSDQEHQEGTVPESSREFDIRLVSGRELQEKDLPPIIYPVGNMVPQGYTVVSAPFKYGKSWLALEMCLAVAGGTDFLGQPTTKGTAVYFALEDCDQFAQERLNMVLEGKQAPEGFYYIYDGVPTLDDDLLGYLNQLYKMLPDLKLVVIDILAKVEYQASKNESAYKCDYRTGGALKQWADDHLISVIAITHTTKMVHPNDVFMNTIGSSGVSGSADALLTIAKEKRTDKDAILAITGRRVREKYFRVHLKDGYIWENDGEVDPSTMQADQAKQEREERLKEYMESPIRMALIKIADMGIDKELSANEIIDEVREQDIYLLNTAAEIGLFIHKYQNYLFTEDGVKVYKRSRGTGSNLYKISSWEPADDDVVDMFTS